MDDIDHKIVGCLGRDSRSSLADIGAAVGLSTSAVNERIRRLAGSGVLRAFTVDVDPEAVGAGVLAYLFVGLRPDADEAEFRAYAAASPPVIECHHVTGSWNYLVKVRVGSLTGVEAFLEDIKVRRFLARSETMIALSTVIDGPFRPKDDLP